MKIKSKFDTRKPLDKHGKGKDGWIMKQMKSGKPIPLIDS